MKNILRSHKLYVSTGFSWVIPGDAIVKVSDIPIAKISEAEKSYIFFLECTFGDNWFYPITTIRRTASDALQ